MLSINSVIWNASTIHVFSSHLTISFAPFQLSHKLDSSGWTRHSHGMVRGPGCNAHLTLESRFLPGENGRLLEFFFPMGREEAKSPSKKHEERRLEADCDPDYRTKTYGGQGGNGRFKGKNGGWFFQVYFGSDFFKKILWSFRVKSRVEQKFLMDFIWFLGFCFLWPIYSLTYMYLFGP